MGKSSINGNGIFQLYHLIFNHCFMLKFIKKHIKTEKIVYDKSHFPKKKKVYPLVNVYSLPMENGKLRNRFSFTY